MATKHQTVRIITGSGFQFVPAKWIGQTIAITTPFDHDASTGPNRGHWIVSHVASGFSAGSLLTTLKQATSIAKEWDQKFASIDATNARGWEHCKAWGAVLTAVNTGRRAPVATPADDGRGTDTAMLLAAEAGIAVQCEPVAKIQWRGKFWPAPTDSELDAWTFDSVAETPDGRTVEPDAPDSWLRILRLV